MEEKTKRKKAAKKKVAKKKSKSAAKKSITKKKITKKELSKAIKISAADRQKMIAEAAYYRAEKRGFQAGDPIEDWLAAENEVDQTLNQSQLT